MHRGGQGRPILGVAAFFHDSAAALLAGGELRGFAEEDRLSGVKHAGAYPERSIAHLLADAGLAASEIGGVAFHMSTPRYLMGAARAGSACLRVGGDGRRRLAHALSVARRVGRQFRNLAYLGGRFPESEIVGIPHHAAHAAYAFLSSGYDRSAILVLDSIGEYASGGIFHAGPTWFRRMEGWSDPNSLGYVYGAVTAHLGFKRNDEEGTVMALAALGDPSRFRSVFAEGLRFTPTGFEVDERLFPRRVLDSRMSRVTEAFVREVGPRRLGDDPLRQDHADVAAALQERTEEAMCHLARVASRLTHEENLCLVGGVAQNCVGAGRVAEEGAFSRVFVPCAPGDSGNAIGAASVLWRRQTRTWPKRLGRKPYLGPVFAREAIDRALHDHRLESTVLTDPIGDLAIRLARGEIIGLFRGALEAGPRALGHRSILASPLRPNVVAELNAKVKFREPFRPFAPMLRAEDLSRWFEPIRGDTRFMSFAVTARKECGLPLAIVHGNGRARVQTVEWREEPDLHALLSSFGSLTGLPILINTSLNVKGRPIAGTPALAIECLLESGIDGLLLEDRYVPAPRRSAPADRDG